MREPEILFEELSEMYQKARDENNEISKEISKLESKLLNKTITHVCHIEVSDKIKTLYEDLAYSEGYFNGLYFARELFSDK